MTRPVDSDRLGSVPTSPWLWFWELRPPQPRAAAASRRRQPPPGRHTSAGRSNVRIVVIGGKSQGGQYRAAEAASRVVHDPPATR